ncbi:MAG: L-serine ammonia-lyase [Lentisphaerae bacterium GWF2_44_16]|nr:MAG: L-serine ammonia-lyase [Lentisphaerae bacterium GWF2_44_16]
MKKVKNIIDTSIFEIFKIGPGPSSSHTIGPMLAAGGFLQSIKELPEDILKKSSGIKISLFGSLSSTGKGHGTDRSVAAGLLGWKPDTCDSALFSELLSSPKKTYNIDTGKKQLQFNASDITFEKGLHHDFPFQNTVIFRLMSGEKTLLEKEYYSIGGGFIKCKGEKEIPRPAPPYPYSNMTELRKIIAKEEMSLPELMVRNELSISGRNREDVLRGIQDILSAMEDAVKRGLDAKGLLPGPIGLARKAHVLYSRASRQEHIPDRFLVFLNAYALAASEENASGHKVVTAPTSGSAGVLPAVLYLLKHHFNVPDHKLYEGMFVAAAIGFIVKHNASISGAEVGCQGEIGVASAMGAALLSHINGYSIKVVENAAEIALEHHLGMTCDPIGGYVQIPCIERNAVGAVNAYNAYLLASAGDPHKQKIRLDEVVKAMLQTGRDMSLKYKETAKGGLAVCSKC